MRVSTRSEPDAGADLAALKTRVTPDPPSNGSENGSGYHLDSWQTAFVSTRSATIWGGTAQVQRNIVGERVLGLPKEPRAPKPVAVECTNR